MAGFSPPILRFLLDGRMQYLTIFFSWWRVVFLQKFVQGQVDAIDEMRGLLEKVRAYTSLPGLLYHLDAELS